MAGLAQDNHLRGLSRPEFVERIAFHYDQLNYIHPFREGNGRVQRVYWDRVAADAGRLLDWTRVTGAVNDAASRIAAEEYNLGPLVEMFDDVVDLP
jgi:cell filamentation protein